MLLVGQENYHLFIVLLSVRKKKNMIKDLWTANELDIKVQEYLKHFDAHPLLPHLEMVGQGQIDEVLDVNPTGPNKYYQWLACLMRVVKPSQVVELGPAAGISTIMMATQLPITSKLYSVDIDKDLAWKWMKYDYVQVEKILGDDLDLSIYPKELKLKDTDIFFLDTLHTTEQITKELKLYKPYFKKGAIVVLDDIRMPELYPIWESLPYDKCETTYPNHYTGFGHFVV